MPEKPADEFEDILTGRKSRRTPAPRADATVTPSRPGRTRRKFTVDALFTDTRPQATGVEDLAEAKSIALDRIVPDPDQPRRTFDEDRLDELAASIRKEGVLQPIVVRYDGDRDIYVIVHGERRYRASRRAEREVIPALVRDVPEERRLIQQLMENIVRDDLNAVDRARALRALKARMDDAPWEAVAEEVGIRRSRLFQLLDTGKLPEPTQDQIRSGELSEKQSRALQGLPEAYQRALADAIVDRAVPAQVATRVSRALRHAPQQATSLADARAHIERLLDLAIAASDDARAAQTDRLLASLREVAGGNTAGQAELDEIAAVLGTPRYQPARVTKSVSELAQALSHADRSAVTTDPALRQRLRALADLLDRLTRDDR